MQRPLDKNFGAAAFFLASALYRVFALLRRVNYLYKLKIVFRAIIPFLTTPALIWFLNIPLFFKG